MNTIHKPTGYQVGIDPALVRVTSELTTSPLLHGLGGYWRVVIERDGRPAAAVSREDYGDRQTTFYCDAVAEED